MTDDVQPQPEAIARWTDDPNRVEHGGDELRRAMIEMIAFHLDPVDPDDGTTWLIDDRPITVAELAGLQCPQATAWWAEGLSLARARLEAAGGHDEGHNTP